MRCTGLLLDLDDLVLDDAGRCGDRNCLALLLVGDCSSYRGVLGDSLLLEVDLGLTDELILVFLLCCSVLKGYCGTQRNLICGKVGIVNNFNSLEDSFELFDTCLVLSLLGSRFIVLGVL